MINITHSEQTISDLMDKYKIPRSCFYILKSGHSIKGVKILHNGVSNEILIPKRMGKLYHPGFEQEIIRVLNF